MDGENGGCNNSGTQKRSNELDHGDHDGDLMYWCFVFVSLCCGTRTRATPGISRKGLYNLSQNHPSSSLLPCAWALQNFSRAFIRLISYLPTAIVHSRSQAPTESCGSSYSLPHRSNNTSEEPAKRTGPHTRGPVAKQKSNEESKQVKQSRT